MKQIVITFLLFIVMALPAHAIDLETENPSMDVLMQRAVYYGAQADAFAHFCDRAGTMGDAFIQLFVSKKNISDDHKKSLLNIQKEAYDVQLKELEQQGVSCKMIDVALKRYEVMRHLKNTSYLLNGVAPKDIPKDPEIPDLEGFLQDQPM